MRQQRNFTSPPNFNVVVNIQSRKSVKFLLQHYPQGEGGGVAHFKITNKICPHCFAELVLLDEDDDACGYINYGCKYASKLDASMASILGMALFNLC